MEKVRRASVVSAIGSGRGCRARSPGECRTGRGTGRWRWESRSRAGAGPDAAERRGEVIYAAVQLGAGRCRWPRPASRQRRQSNGGGPQRAGQERPESQPGRLCARSREVGFATRFKVVSIKVGRPWLALARARARGYGGGRRWGRMLALLALVACTAGCPAAGWQTPRRTTAPSSASFPRDSCAVVAEEMLARVASTAGWKDPHTRHGPGTQGRYTLLGAEPAE